MASHSLDKSPSPKKVKVSYKKSRYRKLDGGLILNGVCLFCDNYFPCTKVRLAERKFATAKNRRTISFLAQRFGIEVPKKKDVPVSPNQKEEFNFISELLPLCSSCFALIDLLDTRYLKYQVAKYQLKQVVEEIRSLVLKSKSKTMQIYVGEDLETTESHFAAFRKQVKKESLKKDCHCDDNDIVFKLPELKVEKLSDEEFEKYMQKHLSLQVTIPEEDNDNFKEFQLGPCDSCDEEMGELGNTVYVIEEEDIKPDIEELQELDLELSDFYHQSASESDEEVDERSRRSSKKKGKTKGKSISNEKESESDVQIPTLVAVDSLNSENAEIIHNEMSQTTIESPPKETTCKNDALPLPLTSSGFVLPDGKKGRRSHASLPPEELDHSCTICNIQYKMQKELAAHYKSTHPFLFPRNCTEPNCTYGCYLWARMRKHRLLKHATEEERNQKKSFVCQYCQARFFGRGLLAYHIRTHTKERPFQCPTCKKSYRQQQMLDVHIFRVHENVRNFHCPHCEKTFKDHPTLSKHILRHTGEKRHACHIPGCEYKTIHRLALRLHWKSHEKTAVDWVEPEKKRRTWTKRKKFGPALQKPDEI